MVHGCRRFFCKEMGSFEKQTDLGQDRANRIGALGISFVTFALVMLSPGDPVRQMIAGNEDIVVSQVEIDALRHELGLDKPFIFQYLDWLGRAVQGDFGFSYMVKKPCC